MSIRKVPTIEDIINLQKAQKQMISTLTILPSDLLSLLFDYSGLFAANDSFLSLWEIFFTSMKSS